MSKPTPVPEGYFPYRDGSRGFMMMRVIRLPNGDVDCALPINDTSNRNILRRNRKLAADVAYEHLGELDRERQLEEIEKAREDAAKVRAELEAVRAELEALRSGKRLQAVG